MGLFDSKSKTTSAATENSVANYNSGPAQTFSGISTGKNSNISIQTSDYGAIEAGSSLARQALESNGAAFSESVAAISANAKSVIDKTLGIAAKTQVSESAQFQDTLLKLGLIVAVSVAAIAFFKRKG